MGERFFDKLGFQMMQQNQAFMRCPHDIKGVFFDLRLLAGNSEHEDGSIPIGQDFRKRAKVDEILDYLTDYDRSKQNYYKKVLKRLEAVGVLHITPGGSVKIPYYEAEQELGRNSDVNRKRQKASQELEELVNSAGTQLKRLFCTANASRLPYEVMVDYLKREFSCYRAKAVEILKRMNERGTLYLGDDGFGSLASLASPPVAGSGKAGAGAEFAAPRKIPLEPESEPEKERGISSPQLGAGHVGRRPNDGKPSLGTSPSVAGGGEASEASSVRDGPRARGFIADTDSPDLMVEPGDAYRVHDPLHAAEIFLRNKPGWMDQKEGDRPASRYVLVSKWKDLRKLIGPKEADLMWRDQLRDIFEDNGDRGWNNWVGLFVSRLNKAVKLIESIPGD